MRHLHCILGLVLGACNLNVASKNACTADSDCSGKEICANQKCMVDNGVGLACGTDYDCDANTVCVSNKCERFTVRDWPQTQNAIADTACTAFLQSCGIAKLQEKYGSDYEANCRANFVSQATARFSPGPASAAQFDAKFAAACVNAWAAFFAGNFVVRSTFGNWPAVCYDMSHGTLDAGEFCDSDQLACARGEECGWDLWVGNNPAQLNYHAVCLPANLAEGASCSGNEDVAYWSDCEPELYCDIYATGLCSKRLPLGARCGVTNLDCSKTLSPGCRADINTCMQNATCDSTGHCAPFLLGSICN